MSKPVHGYTRISHPPHKAKEYDADEGLNKSWHHAALPSALTTAQWDIDFAEAIKDIKGVDDDRLRRAYAHIQLISGKYGVDATYPCAGCNKANRTCRIYHPAIHTPPWRKANNGRRIGHACSNCRINAPPGGCKLE
jgi:hypothetical protein